MSFTDHKITQFTHKIADLPDQPNLPADELKARFDACPEELRVAHNAVCDDAARLEARVEGIVVDTFGDTIDKEMLSDELAAELDAKATQTALSAVSADVTAEAAARASGDSALSSQISSVGSTAAGKCSVVVGVYTGVGDNEHTFTLAASPKALFIMPGANQPMRLGVSGKTMMQDGTRIMRISGNQLTTYVPVLNTKDVPYQYVAFV